MAKAKPANLPSDEFTEEEKAPELKQDKDGPIVEFYGEGAEDVVFEKDPKARLIRVYGTGLVLVDY